MASLKRIATLLTPTADGFSRAGELLREGNCVAFPTETVYGLGAHALDASAVLKIFEYKARPATDPLIVHVLGVEDALKLVDLEDEGERVFRLFASKFWPGPLTIVAKASAAVPDAVTSGTGFVGLRSPAHPIARELLEAAAVPVAAPSANRFAHVSPTRAEHVMADLGHHPIGIVNGEAGEGEGEGEEGSESKDEAVTCNIGIESTVMKVDAEARQVILFRRGGMALDKIAAVTAEAGYTGPIVATATKSLKSSEGMQAPGQHITHYAPDSVQGFMVAPSLPATATASDSTSTTTAATIPSTKLSTTIVVDFGGQLSHLKPHVAHYSDLSAIGDSGEACKRLFATLRACEDVSGAEFLLLADPVALGGAGDTAKLVEALRDRMFRAASGRMVRLCSGGRGLPEAFLVEE